MKHDQRRGHVRRLAGAAALALLVAACSGSSDGGEAETTAPVTEAPTAPVTEAPTTAAPVVTEAVEEEPAVDASAIPDLPCEEYVAESGYPLKPCDSGVLVETLQRDLESLFPEIAIDGLYGSQTFGFIEQIQTANGLEANGLVSEALAGQIASADSADALGDGSDASETTEVATTEPATTEVESEGDGEDSTTAELCNDLIGNAEDPNFTAETIEACSDLGIDIVGEG